jgi:hypothetical protein
MNMTMSATAIAAVVLLAVAVTVAVRQCPAAGKARPQQQPAAHDTGTGVPPRQQHIVAQRRGGRRNEADARHARGGDARPSVLQVVGGDCQAADGYRDVQPNAVQQRMHVVRLCWRERTQGAHAEQQRGQHGAIDGAQHSGDQADFIQA